MRGPLTPLVALWRNAVAPLVTGADLLAHGYRPGPRVGALLRWLRQEQLDGRLTEKTAAVRIVLERFPPDADEVPPT